LLNGREFGKALMVMFFFLEAKHLMSFEKFPEIESKFERSLNFLGIDRTKATVYLAGNHWSNAAMKFGQANRFRFGILTFGILTSNGKGLDVQDPLPG